MIQVFVYRTSDRAIFRIRLEGHALFDRNGQDIVCAAVSVLAITTINNCERLLGIAPDTNTEPGMIDCMISDELDDDLSERAQLLFEGLVLGLKDIQDLYPKHVSVREYTG